MKRVMPENSGLRYGIQRWQWCFVIKWYTFVDMFNAFTIMYYIMKKTRLLLLLMFVMPFVVFADGLRRETDEDIEVLFDVGESVFNETIDAEKDLRMRAKGSLTMDKMKSSRGRKTGNQEISKMINSEVLGESLCAVIFVKNSLTVSAGENFSNECFLLSIGDIIIDSPEIVNHGTMIAGGKIVLNGEEYVKRGFHEGGFYNSHLIHELFTMLMRNKYTFFKELIPSGYVGIGGEKIFSIPEKTRKRIYEGFLNAKVPNGTSLLMQMVAFGNIDAVEWLLKEGADVYALDEDGITVVNYAEFFKQEVIKEMLIEWMAAHPKDES